MSGAAAAFGAVPAGILMLLGLTFNWGLCEYRGQDCGDAKAWFFGYLGTGTGLVVGYNTYNPALKRPEDGTPVVEVVRAEPEVVPPPDPPQKYRPARRPKA